MDEYEIKTGRKQLLFIICIAIGAFMANLDLTITNTSLPIIAEDLSISPNVAVLFILIYQIFETGFLLIFGKLGDIKGFRLIYISGFFFFCFGSLFCGLSRQIELLLFFRAVQGIGGAMLFSVMMATVTAFLPKNMRGKGIGIVTMAAGVGVAIGPPVGGFITAVLNWRWIFFINVPVGIVAIILGLIIIPLKQAGDTEKKLDWISATASFFMLSLFIYALYAAHLYGCEKIHLVSGSFVTAIVFTLIFIVNERKSEYPLLNRELFKNINFLFPALALVPSFMIIGGTLFVLPFFFEIGKNMNTEKAGLILMMFAVGHLIGPYSGHLTDKFGAKKVLLTGMFGVTVGFIGLFFIGKSTNILYIIILLFIFGLMMAFQKVPNVHLALDFVSLENKGAGAGILGVLRSLGLLMGVLFFEIIFTFGISSSVAGKTGEITFSEITPQAVSNGFHSTMIFGLILSIAAILLILPVREKVNKEVE